MATFGPHWLPADLLAASGSFQPLQMSTRVSALILLRGTFQLLVSRKEYWKLDWGLPLCKTSTMPTICSAVVFSRPPRVAPKISLRLLSNIFTHPVFGLGMDGS